MILVKLLLQQYRHRINDAINNIRSKLPETCLETYRDALGREEKSFPILYEIESIVGELGDDIDDLEKDVL